MQKTLSPAMNTASVEIGGRASGEDQAWEPGRTAADPYRRMEFQFRPLPHRSAEGRGWSLILPSAKNRRLAEFDAKLK